MNAELFWQRIDFERLLRLLPAEGVEKGVQPQPRGRAPCSGDGARDCVLSERRNRREYAAERARLVEHAERPFAPAGKPVFFIRTEHCGKFAPRYCGGQPRKPVSAIPRRKNTFVIRHKVKFPRKAREAQYALGILRKELCGRGARHELPSSDMFDSAERIDELTRTYVVVNGVASKIAAARVGAYVVRENHLFGRVSAARIRVCAEGSKFIPHPAESKF